MKIALLGSAPSSVHLAPFGDPSWDIWACSPGAYPVLGRVTEFFEVHRWEPGQIGKPATQKPWFTPEYCQWLRTVPPRVWVSDPAAVKDIGEPRAQLLPWQDLVAKYGHYIWTSTLSYMITMAIERILADRKDRPRAPGERDVIGFWGVDMAANEELYSNQRFACQLLIQILVRLDIDFVIPPESDLATPLPMYGVSEVQHKSIKFLARRREMEARIGQLEQTAQAAHDQAMFLKGGLDDLAYHETMWNFSGTLDEVGDVNTENLKFDVLFPGSGKAIEPERVVNPDPEFLAKLAAGAATSAPAPAPVAPAARKPAKKMPSKPKKHPKSKARPPARKRR